MHVFEKLLVDLKKHQIQNFKSWLYTYSKNYCLMQLRKKTKEISMDDISNFDSQLMESQQDSHLLKEKEVQLKQLETELSKLNNEQRECIKLFYFEERSYQEVADKTGYDLKKVKSYIQNGKRNLMIRLSKSELQIIILFMLMY